MPEAALDNWQLVWNAQVSISTPVCVNFELHPGAIFSGCSHFWHNCNQNLGNMLGIITSIYADDSIREHFKMKHV